MRPDPFDVVIIGGGPAGLSAALVLGRCRRRVLVCDDGHYRNAYSRALHGFLTRDGIDPTELRRLGREQLRRYETVEVWDVRVADAASAACGFELALADGRHVRARKLLLATGLRDQWPEIEGARELYGRSIVHCPYCDGWELRDQPLAIYGRGDHKGGGLALELTLWSRDLVLCTDGPSELSEHYRARLAAHGIPVREQHIERLEGRDGILERIVFEEGETLARRAIFFSIASRQGSDLAARLGCEFDEKGGVKVDRFETTNIPGLFVAGDASRDVLQAIVGAGEGAEAAVVINTALLKEDLK